MKPTRVYHPHPLQAGQDVLLDEPAGRHLTRVLRMQRGEVVTLFDGRGGEHRGDIVFASREGVRVRVGQLLPIERESPLRVHLAQVVSAGELMDLTVQKAVELGVSAIQPLLAHRGKVRLEGERAQRRVAHWQRVAIAACEQCGRNQVPSVEPVRDLPEWLGAGVPAGERLLLDPRATLRLKALAPPSDALVVLVGPESGLAEEEEATAKNMGFLAVGLGPRVLRTETAGMAALAVLQALWGDG